MQRISRSGWLSGTLCSRSTEENSSPVRRSEPRIDSSCCFSTAQESDSRSNVSLATQFFQQPARARRRRHDRRDGSQDRTNQRGADLGLRHRPRHNARVLGCLQPVAGLARQVGSASLRPLRGLFIDRRNLHAIFGADEKRSGLDRSRHRRLVERRRRHGAETCTARTVRSPGHHSLPAAGLERCHCLRLPRICNPELEPMASRDRGRPLLARHALSCLAAPALSERDLACFCVARGRLPLFGGPRLLALSISGFSRLYVKKPTADACTVASEFVLLFVAHFDNTFSCVHLHGVIVFSG